MKQAKKIKAPCDQKPSCRSLYDVALCQGLGQEPGIALYQYARNGTNLVSGSLRSASPKQQIYHGHLLVTANLCNAADSDHSYN